MPKYTFCPHLKPWPRKILALRGPLTLFAQKFASCLMKLGNLLYDMMVEV